ncbi:CU044_5270 family protein [Pseudarthrobacter albicanus]|uniref:CU044_5270 family protein n=1 Tax=Pseudarthrobacter albicanus TaxID=2823873 RepID=UPI001BABA705|nr:CU044_5270 family protein [Pseudarthrobacter albicanus]
MSKTTMSGSLERRLASADPGGSVTEAELARSGARSLSFLIPDAGAAPHEQLPAGQLDGPQTPVEDGPVVVSLSSRRPRRFVRRTLLLSAAAAAVLAGVLVAADVLVPGAQPGATAQAAEVLSNAAAATIKTSDPVVKTGQYLKIDTKAVYSTGTVTPDGTQLAWLVRTGGQVYVPADRNGEWIWNREDRVPDTFFSAAAKAEATTRPKSLTNKNVSLAGIQRAPRGAFYGNGQTVINGMPLDEGIRTFPRDPKALLALIYERTKGAGPSPEEEALITIADTLRTGVIPADLRAALYKSAALIPGITVVDRQATLDGRTGVAIGMEGPDGGGRTDIIIDPATGLLIGERNVTLKATADFPAGTATSWTSVATSVVDSAP